MPAERLDLAVQGHPLCASGIKQATAKRPGRPAQDQESTCLEFFSPSPVAPCFDSQASTTPFKFLHGGDGAVLRNFSCFCISLSVPNPVIACVDCVD